MSDLTKLAKGKSITAGGVATNYLEVGSGSPVLFLHGSVFVTRPLSAVLMAGALALLIRAVLPALRKKRDEVFAE